MKVDKLITFLRDESIETWFDLGIFLDRFKEEQDYPSIQMEGDYEDFKENLRTGGIAFLTFHYMVDGVTIEVNKYASLMRRGILIFLPNAEKQCEDEINAKIEQNRAVGSQDPGRDGKHHQHPVLHALRTAQEGARPSDARWPGTPCASPPPRRPRDRPPTGARA